MMIGDDSINTFETQIVSKNKYMIPKGLKGV